ncbi:MAG TPA: ArgE/DapE family deacylase, partial [Acidimicrobiales bacterium]|nr:ArgE/DapE family deacylase [Acidimicrobiales bacterium]
MLNHVDVDQLVRLTSELVSIDTANPPGSEAAVAGVLRDAMAPWGVQWQEVEPAPGRLSLVGRLAAGEDAGKAPTLIVNGHTDVVPVVPERWSRSPFTPVLSEGRLYGRGTADMKGGVAAAICALATLDAAGASRGCNLVFQWVADEERGGGQGTRVLMEKGLLRGDACIVPEPTSLAVCVAERGLLQGKILIKGRPGHGSRPRDGISAVEHAAQVALALHAAEFGDAEHPLLGRPTANVGTIHGGSAVNIVAEQAEVGFDRRLLPGMTIEEAVAGIERRLAEAGLSGIDYTIEVEDFGEGSEMSPDDPFASLVRSCVASVTGTEPPTIGMSFTTDARFVRNQGG